MCNASRVKNGPVGSQSKCKLFVCLFVHDRRSFFSRLCWKRNDYKTDNTGKYNIKDTVLILILGLPWGWHFNPHSHPITTGIPMGIPMGIPIPTDPEVSILYYMEAYHPPQADSCCLLGRVFCQCIFSIVCS